MKLIFCGSRDWKDKGWIIQVMSSLQINLGDFTVIEGEAEGADKLSRECARLVDLPIDPTPADWKRYGKAAGPIRNTAMLIEKEANGVVAFHNDILHSKGTGDMVRQARKAGKPVWICTDGPEAFANFIIELKRTL